MLILLVSNISFAADIDYKEFSKTLLKVASELSNIEADCGNEFRDVKYEVIENGVTAFQFILELKGHGRMGQTIFKKCDVKIITDKRPTWYDGAIVYDLKYTVLPIK